MKSHVKAMWNENIPFWTLVLSWVKGDWWKTIFIIVTVVLIVLLCGHCILQCNMNFVTKGWCRSPRLAVGEPGAIYPYEWCSYYELRASRAGNEGGNGQNRLHLESRAPSWAGLWTWSFIPSIYENDIPTGKPDTHLPHPAMEKPQGSYLNSTSPTRIP